MEHNFHWEVSTGISGLPFQEFRFSQEFSSGTNRKTMFHLQPNQNFRNFEWKTPNITRKPGGVRHDSQSVLGEIFARALLHLIAEGQTSPCAEGDVQIT